MGSSTILENRAYFSPSLFSRDGKRDRENVESLSIDDSVAATIEKNCGSKDGKPIFTATDAKMLVRAYDILGAFGGESVNVPAGQGKGFEAVSPQKVRNTLKELLEKAKEEQLNKDDCNELYKNVTAASRVIANEYGKLSIIPNKGKNKKRLIGASFRLAKMRFHMAQQLDYDDKAEACQGCKDADDRLCEVKFRGNILGKSMSIDEIKEKAKDATFGANFVDNASFIFTGIEKTGKITYSPARINTDAIFTFNTRRPLTRAQLVDYLGHESKTLIFIKEVLNSLGSAFKNFFASLGGSSGGGHVEMDNSENGDEGDEMSSEERSIGVDAESVKMETDEDENEGGDYSQDSPENE